MLAGGAIAWCSKTQSATALSFTEAEFYAVAYAAKFCLFLHRVLN